MLYHLFGLHHTAGGWLRYPDWKGVNLWQWPRCLAMPAGSFLRSSVTADLRGWFNLHMILAPLQFFWYLIYSSVYSQGQDFYSNSSDTAFAQSWQWFCTLTEKSALKCFKSISALFFFLQRVSIWLVTRSGFPPWCVIWGTMMVGKRLKLMVQLLHSLIWVSTSTFTFHMWQCASFQQQWFLILIKNRLLDLSNVSFSCLKLE